MGILGDFAREIAGVVTGNFPMGSTDGGSDSRSSGDSKESSRTDSDRSSDDSSGWDKVSEKTGIDYTGRS